MKFAFAQYRQRFLITEDLDSGVSLLNFFVCVIFHISDNAQCEQV